MRRVAVRARARARVPASLQAASPARTFSLPNSAHPLRFNQCQPRPFATPATPPNPDPKSSPEPATQAEYVDPAEAARFSRRWRPALIDRIPWLKKQFDSFSEQVRVASEEASRQAEAGRKHTIFTPEQEERRRRYNNYKRDLGLMKEPEKNDEDEELLKLPEAELTPEQSLRRAQLLKAANVRNRWHRTTLGYFRSDPKYQRLLRDGLLSDFSDFADNPSGRWRPTPDALWPRDHAEAILFPKLVTQSAADRSVKLPDELIGRVSLVCVTSNGTGTDWAEQWSQRFADKFWDATNTQYLELSVFYMAGARSLRRWSVPRMRAAIPRVRWPFVLLYWGEHEMDTDDLMHKKLPVTNPHTCTVFLVDRRGRLRWQAEGKPTAEDLDLLDRLAQELVDEPKGLRKKRAQLRF